MKKALGSAVVATALVLSLGACGASANGNSGTNSSTTSGEPASTTGGEEIANPWVDCDTLDAAASIAGFSIEVPDALDGYDGRSIQATDGETIQVVYGNPEDEESPVVYVRKAAGEGDDISGDYTEYTSSSTLDAGGVKVSVRGENGLWNDATWSKDGYSYAITATNGLDDATVVELVGQIG